MPTQEQRAEAGKCWTEKIFRQALEKCKDQFSIEQWSWKKDTWPAYIIQFQIAGEDEIHYISLHTDILKMFIRYTVDKAEQGTVCT